MPTQEITRYLEDRDHAAGTVAYWSRECAKRDKIIEQLRAEIRVLEEQLATYAAYEDAEFR